MRVAFDTNVLVYAEGVDDVPRQRIAADLIKRLGPHEIVMPAQTLGELALVLARKGRRTDTGIRQSLDYWCALGQVHPTDRPVLMAATELSAAHRLAFWDAVVLATAAEAGCDLLLSEDMQDGFVWRGVTVANPFAATPHPLLTAL